MQKENEVLQNARGRESPASNMEALGGTELFLSLNFMPCSKDQWADFTLGETLGFIYERLKKGEGAARLT